MKRVQNILGLFVCLLICTTVSMEIPAQQRESAGIPADQDTVVFRTDFEPGIDVDSIADLIQRARDTNYTFTQRLDFFGKGLEQVHIFIVKEAVDRLPMSDTMVIAGLRELDKNHDSLSRVYFEEFNDLQRMRKASEPGTDTITFDRDYSLRDFARIVASRTCDVLKIALSIAASEAGLGRYVPTIMTAPCEIVLVEIVHPLLNQLRESGYIEDSMIMEVDVHSHLRSLLANLTTVQDEFEVTVVSRFPRDVTIFTSTASLTTKVHAVVSAGFDIGDTFLIAVSTQPRRLIITLPEPHITMVDMKYEVTEFESPILASLDAAKINDALVESRAALREKAIQSGLLEKAWIQAYVIIKRHIIPLTFPEYQDYELELRKP